MEDKTATLHKAVDASFVFVCHPQKGTGRVAGDSDGPSGSVSFGSLEPSET